MCDKILGADTIKAPGFGAMGMSVNYGPRDDAESKKVLQHSIDLGCTFWDTSNMYGPHHNEKLLGQVLAQGDNRSKVFLCTKFGYTFDENDKPLGVRGDPAHVRASLESSLERLGTKSVDLFYQHRVDVNTPIEDTVREMDKLRKEGKCKYIGMSEANADTLRKAAQTVKIDAFQIEYSPWAVEIETNGILDVCKEFDITVVAYSPLGRGFLTGQIKSLDDLAPDDRRRGFPRFKPENFEKNMVLVEKLKEIADKKSITPSQLSLAWIMKQGNIIPIPGCKSIKRLDENWNSRNVTITDEDDKAIRAAISACNIVGDRYNSEQMARIGL